MKVYIVGIGMDGEKTLTREAENAINEAGLLIGAERMIKPFRDTGKETFCSYIPQDIADKLNSCSYDTAAVLMSGDCGFFSGTKKLLLTLKNHDVKVISGISSVSYFCSRIGISYEKMKFITLHGHDSSIAINVMLNEYCFFLLGGNISAKEVCRKLSGCGLEDVNVYIGSDLGYQSEKIITGKASELHDIKADGLAVLVAENPKYLRYIPSAINDEKFLRRTIPMTKSEVRGIVISKLNIHSDSVVWDIGCGTGTVSVEAAYRCPDGKVLAFDKKPEAAVLTAENAARFGCDNIYVTQGECPEILRDAEAPDKVFIGGSSGNMCEIFEVIRRKNQCADIVVTAVSLETLHDAAGCFKNFGIVPEIVQISVTRTNNIGSHTMLQAQNPIFIISGRIS